ncbi:MAG TPA: hypothetical protein VFE90_07560 [Myxococcales bacterium]|nr:hypothetical protein [Myxococcales bacterium]
MSLLPSFPELPVVARPRRGLVRWAVGRVRGYARGVQPPPAEQTEQALYGFAQPILGVRVLLSDPELLKESLYPAALLAAACAIYASVSAGGGQWVDWFKHFYKAFAALAPLPSFFFANHYARLASMIRWRLGFGACGPREMPWGMLAGRMIRQALIVAVGIAPVIALAKALPGIGDYLSGAALAIWSLHWVVADAFDDSQVRLPGESLKESIQRDRNAQAPWFVRWLRQGAARLPRFLGAPVRWFAGLCDKLALDSRGEIATMEHNRAISLGFSLSTAGLLFTPVLNLLFRPIIIAGSSHLLGQLEKEEQAGLNGAETPISALAK